ncbi:hypothetical protein MNBD_UNCLBAC01-1575 [hydrothermal vent metagenome]|uniref:Prepilin-type N-terminal cleavage/methylation domain-containing protein n=1 Tax=hydrothermal vent metagenome TaxID=652676 RepID=A0A3B1D7Q7_9ZZZZ
MLRAIRQNKQPVLGKAGFSILEVIISAVIFVIAVAGVLSSVSMLRPKGGASSKKLEATYTGKSIIDQLRSEVDAGTWDTGNLQVGVDYTRTVGSHTVNYYLVDVPSGCTSGVDCAARQMFMNIYYTE